MRTCGFVCARVCVCVSLCACPSECLCVHVAGTQPGRHPEIHCLKSFNCCIHRCSLSLSQPPPNPPPSPPSLSPSLSPCSPETLADESHPPLLPYASFSSLSVPLSRSLSSSLPPCLPFQPSFALSPYRAPSLTISPTPTHSPCPSLSKPPLRCTSPPRPPLLYTAAISSPETPERNARPAQGLGGVGLRGVGWERDERARERVGE